MSIRKPFEYNFEELTGRVTCDTRETIMIFPESLQFGDTLFFQISLIVSENLY